MRYHWTLLAALFAVTPLVADDNLKPNTLTPQEIADGWILLFDGETTFGWKSEGDSNVENGEIRLGGEKESKIATTSKFGDFEVRFEYLSKDRSDLGIGFNDQFTGYQDPRAIGVWVPLGITVKAVQARNEKVTDIQLTLFRPKPISTHLNRLLRQDGISFGLSAPAGSDIRLRNLKLKSSNLQSVFNGKDLAGWKRFTSDEKRAKSIFSVTPEGWLNIKDGPGDLQTEGKYADFVFQGECISNGKHLNSGIFFRCLPGQYQQGYEMQIRNQWEGEDRANPVDYGTGAIYRRQKARKVVSTDGEWFTMTLIAHGRHMATWINGYQTVDWTDPRPDSDNARDGCKLGAGPLSIQGHDPTTDLTFRNLRVVELKKE